MADRRAVSSAGGLRYPQQRCTSQPNPTMLRHREDLRPLFFHAVYFGLLAFAFHRGVVDWWSVPLVMLLLRDLVSGRGADTSTPSTSPVFRGRWPNKVYQVVLTLIYGHPVSSYVPGHNLSHTTNIPKTRRDVMRTTKTRFRYNGFNVLFFFFAVGPSIMRADAQYTIVMRKRHPRWFRQGVAELSILMVVQVAFAHHRLARVPGLLAAAPSVRPVGHRDNEPAAA